MHDRRVRGALILALTGVLAFAGVASADIVLGDGDAVEPGTQTFVDLGEFAPSAIVTVPVTFDIVCSTVRHVDPGQTVNLTWSGGSASGPGAAILSVTSASVGPVPAGWTADGTGCDDPAPVFQGTVASTVRLRAPSVPNVGYIYTITWSRSISPVGGDDARAISGTASSVSFSLDVVTNASPVLTVPADQTVEGDTTGGWVAAYAGLSATDAEDDPDPTPICSPAAGEVLPLGTTTVACTVTDSGGRSASDSFDVTVVDTTAPSIDVADDQTVTTHDPAGATVTYDAASASDIVDPAPSVGCLPASGSLVPVGTTTVTCTATDASGNGTSGSFDMTVDYVAVHDASAVWMEPVGSGTDTFVANRGRTIPVKVSLSIDGAVRTTGSARLTVRPCGGGEAVVLPLTFGGGRWNAALDTSPLAGGCHTVSASIDGLTAGSFTLDLRGTEAAKAKAAPKGR